MAFAVYEDLFQLALPAGVLNDPARKIASRVGNTLELGNHALRLNTPIRFSVSSSGVLPSPLVAATTYYAIPTSDGWFAVSATESGPALTLTAGSGTYSVIVSIREQIEALLETYSVWLAGKMTAHDVPTDPPYHAVLTYIVVVRTAAALCRMRDIRDTASQIYALDSEVLKDVGSMIKGIPLRGPNTPTPANLARFSRASIYKPKKGRIR